MHFRRLVLRVTSSNKKRCVEYRKPVDRLHVPLSDLLSPRWQRKLAWVRATQRAKLTAVRAALLQYRVTLIAYRGQELEEARELFVRINSAGTTLASADRAFALAQRVDLRAKTKILVDSLHDVFGEVAPETVLQALALASNIDDVGERAQTQAAQRWERKAAAGGLREFDKTWRGVCNGIKAAVDTLRAEFGVYSASILPSQYMLATLARYHAVHATLSASARREVRAWFWATAIGQRYSGRGFRTNVIADAKMFSELAHDKNQHFRLSERIPVSDLRSAKYGTRSSVLDALCLLLALERPRDLLDGKEFLLTNQLSASAKLHRHHVFPRRLLARKKVPRGQANSVLNLCLARADSNSRFGQQAPYAYLYQVRRERWYRSALRRNLLPDLTRGACQ